MHAQFVWCNIIVTLTEGHTPSLPPQPDLLQLKRLSIPQEVGIHFKDFGLFLLNDGKGARVNNIIHAQVNRGDPVAIVTAILEEWLAGRGIPVTWDKLIQTLTDCQLNALAHTVKSHLQ